MKDKIEGLLHLIKKRRREMKITQMEMAEHLGMKSNVGYQKIENGASNMRLDQFLAICEKLDIDPLKDHEKESQELMVSVGDANELIKKIAAMFDQNSKDLEESFRKVIREELKKNIDS